MIEFEKLPYELYDTIDLMNSEDYKDRFVAEYWQTKIRYNKLFNMYVNWDNLDFTPTCNKTIYKTQLNAMTEYLNVLTIRANIENIDLDINETP